MIATMRTMKESTAQIQEALARFDRRALLDALRPGISSAQTRSALARQALSSTTDLEDLYAWRDGTDTDTGATLGDLYMFPGFYLLSLEDAVANYRAFLADSRWAAGWFPVFASGGGDFYVIDLSSIERGSVRRFRVDETEHPIEFRTLEAMLATLAAAFEHGVFVTDATGYLEMDDLEFGSLAGRLNPGVRWWADS
jgi:hypothetical protein